MIELMATEDAASYGYRSEAWKKREAYLRWAANKRAAAESGVRSSGVRGGVALFATVMDSTGAETDAKARSVSSFLGRPAEPR